MQKIILIIGLCLTNQGQACFRSSSKAAMIDQLTVQAVIRASDGAVWHATKECKPKLDKDDVYTRCLTGELRRNKKRCATCNEEISFAGYSRAELLLKTRDELQFFLDAQYYSSDPVTGDILK